MTRTDLLRIQTDRAWQGLWTLIYHDAHHGAEIGCLRRLFAAR